MKKFLLILVLLMAFVLAACGGGGAATDAPVETEAAEATEAEPTDVPATDVPTETPVPAAAGAIADVFPCDARAVEDQGNLLRVVHRQADSNSPVVGARRAGQAFQITEVRVDAGGVTWYNVSENNRSIGWIEPQYVILSEGCVSGGSGAEATAEASSESEEATAEATEE